MQGACECFCHETAAALKKEKSFLKMDSLRGPLPRGRGSGRETGSPLMIFWGVSSTIRRAASAPTIFPAARTLVKRRGWRDLKPCASDAMI